MTRDNTIYNLETKEKLMDLYIQNLKKSVEIIDSIIPIIWKFDGKVYNAKFENTLKNFLQDGKDCKDFIYPHVELNYSRIRIKLCFYNNRSVHGANCSYYLPDGLEEVTLCYESSNWSSYKSREENLPYYDSGDLSTYFYIDGNNTRIKASRIVDLILENQKELKQKITELEEERKNVLDYVTRLNKIREELDSLNDIIPCSIKSIYEIKTYANFYWLVLDNIYHVYYNTWYKQ